MTKKKVSKKKPSLAELYNMPQDKLKKLADDTVKKAERDNFELISLSKKLYLVAWFLIGLTFLLIVIVGWQHSNQNSMATTAPVSSSKTELSGWATFLILSPAILIALSLTALTSVIPMFWGMRSNPRGMILDPLAIPRIRKRMSIISMIAIVPLIAALLTLVGFVNIVFEFLKSAVLPGVTNLVNMILANLVSWVLSGVIGNFIYDLLKKWVTREKQTLGKNAK